MQKRVLIDNLNSNTPTALKYLEGVLGVSERTVRTLVKSINEDSSNGTYINNIRGQGYILVIKDQKKYEHYLQTEKYEDYVGNRKLRLPRILFFLLQQETYIPIQEIADLVMVSKATLVKDLDDMKRFLKHLDLELESKPHYGIKVVGTEANLRKAFSKFVMNSHSYISATQPIFNYIKGHSDRLTQIEVIKHILSESSLMITQNSLDSILEHLAVLVYRVQKRNFITEMQMSDHEIPELYLSVAKKIINEIEVGYSVKLPENETLYLASQLMGKTVVDSIPFMDKEILVQEISRVLTLIDEEFKGDFSKDETLSDALLMHMYPLLTRIAHKIYLDNPLIEFVSSRYANVFLVAIRFVELWNGQQEADLSRDEVGYLALHFASHLERRKKKAIYHYKRILVISEVGRGNVLLNVEKLQEAFPKSVVGYDLTVDYGEINNNAPDLVLTTLPVDKKKIATLVLEIPELLSDLDVVNIKDFIVLNYYTKRPGKSTSLIDIFNKEFFETTYSEDYLKSIYDMSLAMVKKGFADVSFPTLVIDRENRFSTIYEQGVAGPHSMSLNAKKEAIGVIIPKGEMRYLDKEINLIFLINIYKGNLFRYREISKLMQAIINHSDILVELKKVETYDEFIKLVSKIKY